MAFDDPDEPHGLVRHTDPQPSHDAAARVEVTRLEGVVLDTLGKRPATWLTSIEVSHLSGEDKWSISPRMKPLYEKGKIERGKKMGLNSNGKPREMLAYRIKVKEEF